MNKVERAAERFRRSMAAAAAKPVRVVPPVVPPVVMRLCDECHTPLEPGHEVLSFDDNGLRFLCYDCKDIVGDEDEWDEDDEGAGALPIASERGEVAP